MLVYVLNSRNMMDWFKFVAAAIAGYRSATTATVRSSISRAFAACSVCSLGLPPAPASASACLRPRRPPARARRLDTKCALPYRRRFSTIVMNYKPLIIIILANIAGCGASNIMTMADLTCFSRTCCRTT